MDNKRKKGNYIEVCSICKSALCWLGVWPCGSLSGPELVPVNNLDLADPTTKATFFNKRQGSAKKG